MRKNIMVKRPRLQAGLLVCIGVLLSDEIVRSEKIFMVFVTNCAFAALINRG